MQKKSSPTIREVAKRAGVAPITVSRTINNSGYVGRQTRERVEAAIAELGYVPNTLARSLRSRRTNTLALVLTDITNPFWTTVSRGVEDAASSAGYNVILCNTDESEAKQEEYLRVLLEKQVDGVLLVPATSTAQPIRFIQNQNTPVVVLDRRIPHQRVDVVRTDSEGGACRLVQLLLSLGHRRIAVLSGPQSVSTAEDRIAGYRRAMREADMGPGSHIIVHDDYTQQGGYRMAERVMRMTPRPTALFAGNNFIALGALKALRDGGLRVPEDVAVVGFDDLPQTFFIEPFLTVITQPAYEMGRRATQLLLARLSTDPPDEHQEIVLPTELIVRRSTNRCVDVESALAPETST